MTFDEALHYLLSLGHETLAIKLGLDNIARLLELLGSPHQSFTSIQIAGTNGKGSTSSMLEAVCLSAGVKTGLYTSPHLVSITERVRIAGAEISRDDFARHAASVRTASAEVARQSGALPTFFEQVTAIALCAFREARVSLAILETGMGGRLDATTAAGARIVALTPVALDHQEYLGATLGEIAAEKAAIIRPGAIAVVAPQKLEAEKVILARCRECAVEPRAPAAASVEDSCGEARLRVSFATARDEYANICLALRGRHQLTNAAVAVALAEALIEQGFEIRQHNIIEGLERARHAGRLELCAGTPQILLDGAHNTEGARALRGFLKEFVSAPVTLVFGAMRDKNLLEIGAELFPTATRLILTEPDSPRAAPVDELIRAIPRDADLSTITVAPKPGDALTIARAVTPHDGLICVTGSLYLVGEVKKFI